MVLSFKMDDWEMPDDEQADAFFESEDEFERSQTYEHFRFTADKKQTPIRIDKFLTDRLPHTSRNRIQQAAEAGCILIDGQPVKSNYRVKPSDVISIVMAYPRHETEIVPEDIPLDIVYEDEDLLIINKPAGLVVHPGHGNYTGTLVNALAFHFKDHPYYDPSDPRLGLVHLIEIGRASCRERV